MVTRDDTSSIQPLRLSFETRDSAHEMREFASVGEPARNTGSGPYASIPLNEHEYDSRDKVAVSEAHRHSKSQRFDRAAAFWTDTWTAEVLSCALAVCALIGLTVTLSAFHGKALTRYPLGVSLNTIIAVFSAVIKAALLMPISESISQLKWLWFTYARPLLDFVDFDLASRGPWGSILLLIRLRGGHLAAIGAGVTIAALAIDPFSQQLVQYYGCSQIVTGASAYIPRVNNYTGGSGGTLLNGSFLDNFANLDQGMSAAVYLGLLVPPQNASQNVPVTCSTGNCTFPSEASDGATYQTLGFGTTCEDVSSRVKKDTSRESTDGEKILDAYTMPGYEDGNLTTVYNSDISTITSINATAGLSPADSVPFMIQLRMLLLDIDWNECAQYGPGPDMLAECTPKSKALAAECAMYPVIRTINATVINGTLYERVISEDRVPRVAYDEGEETVPNHQLYPWTRIADRTLREGAWTNCMPSDTYSFNTTIRALPGRIATDILTGGSEITKYYAPDCVWTIDDTTSAALSRFLMTMFQSGTLPRTLQLRWGDTGTSFRGEPWMLNLYNNGTANMTTVSRYFHGLEDAMSAAVRTFGNDGNSELVHGKAFTMQTCIAVRWWWISFPAALTLVSILFLAMTYWRTKREKGGADSWKSSSLADLLIGLDEGIRGRWGRIDKKSEMQDVVSAITVKLAVTKGGWRLKEVGKSTEGVKDNECD